MSNISIPARWKLHKINEIYDVRDGTHDSPKYHEEGYPLITSKNLKQNGLNFLKVKYISKIDYEQINHRSKVDKGDLLFAMIGTIGNPTVVKRESGFAIKNVALFKANKESSIYFLQYYLQTRYVKNKMQKEAKGTTQKFVGLGYLRNFPIPVPPLEEQIRIVEILDEAFEEIERAEANNKKNLANARELFDSYLNKVLNNSKNTQWVTLSDLCVAITDGDHQPPPKASEGIPFITISNIDKQNRTIDFSDTFKVSPSYFNKLKEHRRPLQGDILYTVTGSYGIPVIVDDEKKFCFQRHIGLIRPNKETKSRFLYYLLLSEKVKKQADKCATGTAQKTVGLRSLRKFIVPKISLNDQIEITKKLDDTSKEVIRLEEIYQRKLEALAELKQSILQKAFTGKLTT